MVVIKFVAVIRESAFRRGLVRVVREDDEGVEWFRASNILLKDGEGVYLVGRDGGCRVYYFPTGGGDIVLSLVPPMSLVEKLRNRKFVWMFEESDDEEEISAADDAEYYDEEDEEEYESDEEIEVEEVGEGEMEIEEVGEEDEYDSLEEDEGIVESEGGEEWGVWGEEGV